ncbi:integral membrane protein [Thelonectria olida]|uniref:Integral membrane protein n=1 Tax=Thelonectria olida TaxID=1576542 RepID=A0A9P8VZC4_9HYPO|nr:integral membrane protein [Thelonectria olida]
MSKKRTFVVISSVTFITGIGSLLSGVVTVCLPTMVEDLQIAPGLLLWPASVFALTSGCTLLVCGAMADLFGARQLYLLGCFCQSVVTLACGLSRTGTQIIVFRAFAGISISMCLPSSVSLITHSFLPGKRRNIAFAAMGGGQPVGFAIGLSLGGVFADTIGWRWSFYLAAILNTIAFCLALRSLPHIGNNHPVTWQRFLAEVDIVGALLASASLSMLSYVLAIITDNAESFVGATNIVLFVLSLLTFAAFILWNGRQERLNRPAIIPNSLWKNRVFSSICLSVFLVLGAFNATEAFISFFFQYIQDLSAMKASVSLLPAPVGGVLASLLIGALVHRTRADVMSFGSVILSSSTPLAMALVNPSWSYWVCIFPALFFNAVGADMLYTISNLLITSLFPARTQGVAGGVYNTLAQIGKSFGLACGGAVAGAITGKYKGDKNSKEALLEGYRAAFWFCFALYGAALVVIVWGLRRIGKVGKKQD